MQDHIEDDNNGAPPQEPVAADKVTRLTDYITPLFEQAFREHGRGERIVFEIGVQALPGPPAPGAPVNPETGHPDPYWETMMIVYAEIPGIVPSTRIFRGFALMPHAWTQDKADATAKQIVGALIEGRRQQLADMERQAAKSMADGTPAPSHGLIVPGQVV